MISEGNGVAARFTMRGTHQGTFFDVPPTRKKNDVRAMNFYRLSGGQLVEEHGQPDLLGSLQQISAIPEAPATETWLPLELWVPWVRSQPAAILWLFCANRFAANMPTEETIMNGKIVFEEHIESPDFPAIGDHTFTNPADLQNFCTTTPCESNGEAKWS
jgi:SnoaL-like polyketide cyclase